MNKNQLMPEELREVLQNKIKETNFIISKLEGEARKQEEAFLAFLEEELEIVEEHINNNRDY
ncbi:hypothetical protein KY314_00240 [Candidatus Woesearchaeota archaeon]|nr:hypothetical protein [Candidatus Woesearchaeota archaeon]